MDAVIVAAGRSINSVDAKFIVAVGGDGASEIITAVTGHLHSGVHGLRYCRSPRWFIRLSSSLVQVSFVSSSPTECILA